jgi:CxxC motif-containing protein
MSGEDRPHAVELVCIACPIGCRLTIAARDDGEPAVSGNRCSRGEVYGKEEVLAPTRVVTAVVRSDSTAFPYVPVRTDRPLPRPLIRKLMSRLSGLQAVLPIKTGDVLLHDFLGTGVNVFVTRGLPPRDVPAVHGDARSTSGSGSPRT